MQYFTTLVQSKMANSPEGKLGGEWVRHPKGEAAVVFVHGILTKPQNAWGKTKVYWPDLLCAEPSLSNVGVYVLSYRSDPFSKNYNVGYAVDFLYSNLRLDGVLKLRSLVFVCHSMGGIVVRQFLVKRQLELVRKKTRIALFLVASPSLGSEYANYLSAIIRFFGNSQADALRLGEDNAWLNDLDRNFMLLKGPNGLSIEGKELMEDDFIIFKSLWKDHVVPDLSSARYFPNSEKIPNTDHFTIAEPVDNGAYQHRLLVEFISGFLEPAGEEESATPIQTSIRAAASRPVLVPAHAPLWRLPSEKKFWENIGEKKEIDQEEVEAFLEEAKVAKNASITPPFTVEFPWLERAIEYINESAGKTLSVSQRKDIASARGFVDEESRHLTSLKKCILFLMDYNLLRSYGWGSMDSETSARIVTALANRTFRSGNVEFDILVPSGDPYVRVDLSYDECRQLPHIKQGLSDVDLYFELRRYIGIHPDLPSMPYVFLWTKAMPALLDRFVFRDGLDPATGDLPLDLRKWVVGLG